MIHWIIRWILNPILWVAAFFIVVARRIRRYRPDNIDLDPPIGI